MLVVEAAVDIIRAYALRLIDFARSLDVQNRSSTEDSQEFGSDVFTDIQVDTLEFIGVGDPSLPETFRRLILLRLLMASLWLVYEISCALP
jgi:hypothetical protein